MEATFVIIGGGIAGVSCAEALAFLSSEEKTILISSSSLIKAVTNIIPLGKTIYKFDVKEKPSSTLESSSIKVINDQVTRVDPSRMTIETSKGQIINYKKLCICTGARARLITNDNPHVIGIRDTESVDEFSRRIKNARKIIVVGNGGIATEIVHEILNVEIVWVIKDKHISATFFDPGAAEFFRNKLSKETEEIPEKICRRYRFTETKISDDGATTIGAALGPDWHEKFTTRGVNEDSTKVQVEYQCEVSKIISPDELQGELLEDWPIYAELTNGKIIGCDFIVSATGVTPNTDIPGLESLKKKDEGFSVDWKMETSCKNIFAAGDVCTADWDLAEHWIQMRLWTQAHQMGLYAAKSMHSLQNNDDFLQDFCFELFTHVTKFFNYKVVLLGLYNGQKLGRDYEMLLRITKDREYVKLIIKNEKMIGAVLIGDTDLEEMCENLILDQLDLSIYGEDLLNPDIDIEDYFD